MSDSKTNIETINLLDVTIPDADSEKQDTIAKLQRQIDALQLDHKDAGKKVDSIQSKINMIKRQILDLTRTITDLGKKVVDSFDVDEIEKIKAAIATHEGTKKDKEATKLSLEREWKKAVDKKAAIYKEASTINEKIQSLKKEIAEAKAQREKEQDFSFALKNDPVYKGDEEYLNLVALNTIENEKRNKKVTTLMTCDKGGLMKYISATVEGRIRALRIVNFEFKMGLREKKKRTYYTPQYILAIALDDEKITIDGELRDYIWDMKKRLSWIKERGIESYRINVVYHEYMKHYNIGHLNALVSVCSIENYRANIGFIAALSEDEKIVFNNITKDDALAKKLGLPSELSKYGYKPKGKGYNQGKWKKNSNNYGKSNYNYNNNSTYNNKFQKKKTYNKKSWNKKGSDEDKQQAPKKRNYKKKKPQTSKK